MPSSKKSKPNPSPSKKLSIDKPALFKTLTAALSKGLNPKNYTEDSPNPHAVVGILGDLSGVFTAVNLEYEEGQIFWRFYAQALTGALVELLAEQRFGGLEVETEHLGDELSAQLDFGGYDIPTDFFKNPAGWDFHSDVKTVLLPAFLKTCGLDKKHQRLLLNRLDAYFVSWLRQLWQERDPELQRLQGVLKNEFDEVYQQEMTRLRYQAHLKKKVQEPVFGEPYSLEQIYVPLHAYHEEEVKPEKTSRYGMADAESTQRIRHVVQIDQHLDSWIETGKKGDYIKVICGGPGYGKSSLLKMLAARLAEESKYAVYYIPLQWIDIRSNLREGLKQFIEDEGFALNPIPGENDKVLLLLDGLDELSMQGKEMADAAREFIDMLSNLCGPINHQERKLLCILSGRNVIIDQNRNKLNALGQVLQLMPYFLTDDQARQYDREDPHPLLNKDLRQDWWIQFQGVIGIEQKGLPAILQRDDLEEITQQPLLNYLLAYLIHGGDTVEEAFQLEAHTSLNELYDQLIKKVYARDYEPNRGATTGKIHRSVENLPYEVFREVMEEVALVVWKKDGRTAKRSDIAEHLESCEEQLKDAAKKFLKDKEENKGVTNLLASFYFKEGSQGGTIEFSHKSFGEYLAASCMLKRAIKILQHFDILGPQEAERRWIQVFDLRELDPDLLVFLKREIEAWFEESEQAVRSAQHTLTAFWQRILNQGFDKRHFDYYSFTKNQKVAAFAEKAILTLLSLMARQTKESIKITWLQKDSFSRFWYHKMAWCSWPLEASHLVLQNRYLNHLNLNDANLSRANLSGANLSGANLSGANLERADLSGADLSGATLSGANLEGAHLEGAHLFRTHLSGADLSGADLSGANLSGTNLFRANLSGTNLFRAYLFRAYLSGADLSGADLSGAHLSKADLQGARNGHLAYNSEKDYLKSLGWHIDKKGTIKKTKKG